MAITWVVKSAQIIEGRDIANICIVAEEVFASKRRISMLVTPGHLDYCKFSVLVPGDEFETVCPEDKHCHNEVHLLSHARRVNLIVTKNPEILHNM